jgi:hypothetical protein
VTHISKALLVGYPKSFLDSMLRPNAEAGKTVEANMSQHFLSKITFWLNLQALPHIGTCSNFQDK